MKKHEQGEYKTQQNTKREKGRRKAERERGSKGRRTSLLARVYIHEGFYFVVLGPGDPR